MSFFKSLFGVPQASARDYLVTRIDRLESGKLGLEEQFRILILGSIESFGTQHRKPLKHLEPFTNDESLFELACYIFSLAADYLKYTRKDVKTEMLRQLFDEICAIFARLLPDRNQLHTCLMNRVHKYLESIGSDGRHHQDLLRFLKHTSVLNSIVLFSDPKFQAVAPDFATWVACGESASLMYAIKAWDESCSTGQWTDILDKTVALLSA